MKESIKSKIKAYLTEKRGWIFAGLIDDYIRAANGHKTENTGRRLREMAQDGILEVRYENVQGVANKVAQYRIKQQSGNTAPIQRIRQSFKDKRDNIFPDCCPSKKIFGVHALDCITNQEKVRLF